MPIYAYKCASCGHALDVLQKMSDAVLTDCPSCGAVALQKQVTAAGFQLKGSGWYVTDFRNGNAGAPAPSPKAEDGKPAESSPAADSAVAKPADTAAASAAAPSPAPAPAPAPAPSGGTSPAP
jgi:putative FmdB family regulatory protein